MSQVNKCHSVLFPPPIYLASIRSRVQMPNVFPGQYDRIPATWLLGHSAYRITLIFHTQVTCPVVKCGHPWNTKYLDVTSQQTLWWW